VDLGFETDRVLVATLPLPDGRYPDGDARFAFFETLLAQVKALPGVEATGVANRFPLRGGWTSGILFDGEAPGAGHDVAFQAVGGDYFQALGISLKQGRRFEATDVKGAPAVAVVNARFASALSKGDPIGQRFRRGPDRPWITVVGVVSDIRRDGKAASIEPQVYLSAAQTDLYPVRLADFAIRVSGDPAALVKPLQAAVWAIDAEQPLMNVRTLSETVEGTLSLRRFQTLLLALFAGLALLLALVGVYGVVGSTVAQRTHEIGVRMAIGAGASSIARMVVRQSLGPAVAGLTLGMAGAVAMARGMSGLVFGIAAVDPATFAFAPLALLAAVALASLAPALRAARVEPTTALRDE
jgi:predicted permease